MTKISDRVMERVNDPEDLVTLVPLNTFFPYVQHDRRWQPKHAKSDESIDYFKEVIRKDGIDWVFTIFVSKEDLTAQIGEGNHRLRAAFEMGVEQIPLSVGVYKTVPLHGKEIELSPEFIKSPYVPGNMDPIHLFPFLPGYTPDPDILKELEMWGPYLKETEPDYHFDKLDPEHFDIMFARYDVLLAKALLNSTERESVLVDITDIPFKGFIKTHQTERETDLDIPIIIATLEEGHLVIDGYHRIEKASELGIKKLPAQILTYEESIKARIY